jgi:hypothetical protein
VTVDGEDRRMPAGRPGDISVGRHPDAATGLEEDFLDAVSIAFERPEYAWFERARLRRESTPGFEKSAAHILAPRPPVIECRGRLIPGMQRRGLEPDEVQV